MSHLKQYCEVTREKEGELKEGEPETEKDYFFLLHWGLEYTIINEVAVNFTVGICENVKTGQIQTFLPEQIRIIGQKIKE